MTHTKDRKVLRRVDYGAAKTSLAGVLAALLVYALIASLGGLYRQFEFETLVAGGAVVVVSAYRLWLVARFDALYGAGPARWRRLFGAGLIAHALVWGAIGAWLVWRDHAGGFNFFAVVLYNIGVATALGTSWMAGLRVRQLYILLMCVPVVISLVVTAQWQNMMLAVLIGAYAFYLFRLYKGQYTTFWHAVSRERRGGAAKETEQRPVSNIQLSLVYRLAHELRTPMNSVMGMLSLLEDTELDEEQQEYLQVAGRSGQLLLSQIDDVLDYSRILTNRINLSPDYFDLRGTLEKSLDAFGPMAQAKGIEMTCVVDRLLPRRVHGDRERLMQVITNLLSNAIKFSDSGEIRLDVDFTAEGASKGVLRVRVSDQGPGMDGETLQSLFEDTFFESGGETHTGGYTGFGLLVCHGLVKAMGGTINAESVPGEGSTFWFTVRVGVQPDMREAQGLTRALSGTQVLVVGAAPGTVACCREELEALDSQCDGTDDYDHALQVLRTSHREHCDYNIAIVDTWARAESAVNLAKTIVEDPKLASVKPILLTTIEERSLPSVQCLVDKHGLQVVVRPLHRSGLRNAVGRVVGLERPVPVPDAPTQTPEELRRRKLYRLLLVEDNEVNQLVTRGMLSKLGYQVKTVNNGARALALMEKEHFDLVLMDCMMPDMDGFTVTRALREHEQQAGLDRTSVIAITANTAEGVQARCLAAGMDDFLAKPVHLEQLETLLRRWLPETPQQQEGQAQ